MSALLIVAAILATNPTETYEAAYKTTTETNKPMVVMVSTDWCPPCQVMKKTVLPKVREHGLLEKVAFAVVNPDHDTRLAKALIDSGPVPQLVMFRRTSHGWLQKKLVGGQTIENVEKFINDGLTDNEAEIK